MPETTQVHNHCLVSYIRMPIDTVHSFIRSGYFYSTSSSPLLLRGAPDTARILCRSFTPKCHRQLRMKDFPRVPPYVAARVGFEPVTLWSTAIDSTDEPPRPTHSCCPKKPAPTHVICIRLHPCQP